MFLENRYSRIYFRLMERAEDRQLDGYTERHHITPKSLGGGNGKANVVYLTFREHFLAHWLLTKITEGDAKRRMNFAMSRMSQTHRLPQRNVSGWQYARARQGFMDADPGSPFRGRTHTSEWRANHSRMVTGKRGPQTGKPHTLETKAKMNVAHNLRKIESIFWGAGTEDMPRV